MTQHQPRPSFEVPEHSEQSIVHSIHEFWFGPLDERGFASEEAAKQWFKKSEKTDQRIREQFGEWVEHALSGHLHTWSKEAISRLALILLCDQFTRNIYRNTPDAFSGDPTALKLTHSGIELGMDQEFKGVMRMFFYMPLMHSENLEDQRRVVALAKHEAESSGNPPPKIMQSFFNSAKDHLEVIERFGRFPHRNEIFGRESTPEEVDFLKKPGSRF